MRNTMKSEFSAMHCLTCLRNEEFSRFTIAENVYDTSDGDVIVHEARCETCGEFTRDFPTHRKALACWNDLTRAHYNLFFTQMRYDKVRLKEVEL